MVPCPCGAGRQPHAGIAAWAQPLTWDRVGSDRLDTYGVGKSKGRQNTGCREVTRIRK